MQTALTETAGLNQIAAATKLDPRARSRLGQYMTPPAIARFMAGLFEDLAGELRVLDPGAGTGSLAAAFIERCIREAPATTGVEVHCYEIDEGLAGYLSTTLDEVRRCGAVAQVATATHIHVQDFIHVAGNTAQATHLLLGRDAPFSHVIMNPPYKKIQSTHPHRAALRHCGLETSNLYTAFLYLAALLLRAGGELVAIVPRSFCNGPYFQAFRKQFLAMMSLRHVHVFTRRDQAFEDDKVLQENIILHAVRDQVCDRVTISTSQGAHFHFDAASGDYAT